MRHGHNMSVAVQVIAYSHAVGMPHGEVLYLRHTPFVFTYFATDL